MPIGPDPDKYPPLDPGVPIPDDAERERLVQEVLRIRDRGPLTRDDGTVCRVWGAVVFSELAVARSATDAGG